MKMTCCIQRSPTAPSCRYTTSLLPACRNEDFLSFIADQAQQNERVAGVRTKTPTGALTINVGLVVGTDGRRSRIREQAGLPVRDFQVPIDIPWMRTITN